MTRFRAASGRSRQRLAAFLGPVLGPSARARDDQSLMAPVLARVDPWDHMPQLHRTAHPTRPQTSHRREALRLFAIVLSVIALVLTSSALNWVTEAHAADEVPAPKKAVIVSGPVHSLTAKYKEYAKAIADAAEAQGMETYRIFHPYATKAKVKLHANGADLFVYVGHGNGWPSAYGPFQEDTKNGLGLNPDDPDKRTTSNVLYKGANWLRDNIEFAPNAVVILSHLSYASGNASSGMAIPTRDVARQRVDNFANGFLSCGARVVWALGWQPGADVVDALHEENATMDAVFMTRYRDNVNPLNGWIGHNPGYYDSERIPGARVHIDPDPTYGYLRGITGDLDFTTTEWREAGTLPADTTAPVISEVRAFEAGATLSTADSDIPVFTPNGDGVSDSIKVSFKLSERAFVEMQVKKDGDVLRDRSLWSMGGTGSLTWDGRKDSGKYTGEGTFKIVLTPRDRAGNRGEPAVIKVKVLNSLKGLSVSPDLFYSADGDGVAQTATFSAKVTRDATASWTVVDRDGKVVRRGPETSVTPGTFKYAWDGADDAGRQVAMDKYFGRATITRPGGTYAHDVKVRMASFTLRASKWTVKRGDKVTLTIESGEPLLGKPVVTANQPNIAKYTIAKHKITKVSKTYFKVTFRTRDKGKKGTMYIRVKGYDREGGSQYRVFKMKVR